MAKKYFFIFLTFLLVSFYCLAHAIELSKDSLAGIRPGDSVQAVIKKYGQPESKTDWEDDYTEDGGDRFRQYEYPSRGLTFEIAKKGKIQYVAFIWAEGESKARTSKNIGIGSSMDDVIKAYGKPDLECDGYVYYDPKKENLQLMFSFDNEKVSLIRLGYTSEECQG